MLYAVVHEYEQFIYLPNCTSSLPALYFQLHWNAQRFNSIRFDSFWWTRKRRIYVQWVEEHDMYYELAWTSQRVIE